MIVTRNIGKQTIITFKERFHEILRGNWKTQKMSESEVTIQTFTIYSCLKFPRQNTCMNALITTFDQLLYAKAIDICTHHPPLFTNSLIRLGEFHLLMSCMGVHMIYYVW